MENLIYVDDKVNESGRSKNRDLECLEDEINSCMEEDNVCNVKNSDIFKSIIKFMEKMLLNNGRNWIFTQLFKF